MLLVESGSRRITQIVIPHLRAQFGDGMAIDVVTCFTEPPAGAAEIFSVNNYRGRRLTLVRELRGRVAGPALPRYVLDLPQGDGKVLLEDSAIVQKSFERVGDGLKAVIYDIRGPSTREGSGRPARYLDLSVSQ